MKHIKIFEEFDEEYEDIDEFETDHDLDVIVDGYLDALFFTEEGVHEDEYGNDTMEDKTLSDIDNDTKVEIEKEVEWFVNSAGDVFEELSDDQIGHDFWLTRNGHGSGFFERINDSENLETIEELCNILGTVGTYVGDDGKIHCESNDRYKTFDLEEHRKKKKFDKTVKKFNL